MLDITCESSAGADDSHVMSSITVFSLKNKKQR